MQLSQSVTGWLPIKQPKAVNDNITNKMPDTNPSLYYLLNNCSISKSLYDYDLFLFL